MKEQFLDSPSLEHASAIAGWLNALPHHPSVLIPAPEGGHRKPELFEIVDWHIIPIQGKYQVIAHILTE